jgi:hypothetical protein
MEAGLDDGSAPMSLHRKLVLAFGAGGAVRPIQGQNRADKVLVGASQAEDRPRPEANPGFSWKRVDFAVVISPAGEIIDIERPPWRARGKRSKTSMLVPQRQLLGQGGFSGFLWGSSVHALGLRRWGVHGDVRADAEAFNRFRTFHRVVLANARDPSLRAFLEFLKTWRPEWAFDSPDLGPVIGGSLVFRFQYDEYFLHESHAARLIWSRLLGAPNGQDPPEAA